MVIWLKRHAKGHTSQILPQKSLSATGGEEGIFLVGQFRIF